MKHGFMCLCCECSLYNRVLKLAVMARWQSALTEAQKEGRAYSWHRCYEVRS